jgi:hypothetical protein
MSELPGAISKTSLFSSCGLPLRASRLCSLCCLSSLLRNIEIYPKLFTVLPNFYSYHANPVMRSLVAISPSPSPYINQFGPQI